MRMDFSTSSITSFFQTGLVRSSDRRRDLADSRHQGPAISALLVRPQVLALAFCPLLSAPLPAGIADYPIAFAGCPVVAARAAESHREAPALRPFFQARRRVWARPSLSSYRRSADAALTAC